MATSLQTLKDNYQRDEFPILCSKCYGDNPYIRMTKADYDAECKICGAPFTVFSWSVGRGKYKKTEVCQTCARLKNLCQCCILDLEFSLPYSVRDAVLPESARVNIPEQKSNIDFFNATLDQRMKNLPYNKPLSEDTKMQKQLKDVARRQKHMRNRVCTYWLEGKCTRGMACPFLHTRDNVPKLEGNSTSSKAAQSTETPTTTPSIAPPVEEPTHDETPQDAELHAPNFVDYQAISHSHSQTDTTTTLPSYELNNIPNWHANFRKRFRTSVSTSAEADVTKKVKISE